ncbi:PEP-CTERM sorting domain-containing protein [Phycisphaeraceae bacterium D3-23]
MLTFELDNVFTDRGGQMTGEFTWTYTPGDFENGVGVFTALDVPHTAHGLEDLVVTIETSQIEVSLDGSFHDDGVDVTLVLQQPFSPDAPAALDLTPNESKYSIGGNGFIDGDFISGAVSLLAAQLAGDITGDGYVGAADLDVLLANWGEAVGADAWSLGDLSGDGEVGRGDLDLVLSNWGNGTPPDLSVPEPGTLAGFAAILLCTACRRRR